MFDPGVKIKKNEIVIPQIGEVMEELMRRALREPGFTLPVSIGFNKFADATFIPGHIWRQGLLGYLRDEQRGGVDGPHPARVFALGKMPGAEEHKALRNFVGPTGHALIDLLKELKVPGLDWYITNLLKFFPPNNSSKITANWRDDCLPLLHQELRIVRPEYILCFGADASQAILGEDATIRNCEGRVLEYTYKIGAHKDDDRTHTAQVVTVLHPVQITRDLSARKQVARGLSRFNMLTNGIRFDLQEKDIDHRVIRTKEELEALLEEVERTIRDDKRVAVDAEWHGQHPINKGAYLRLIQFSWLPKKAACIVLRHKGGGIAFSDKNGKDATDWCRKRLRKFFADKRVVGHFFNADLEWLVHWGLDLRKQFHVPRFDLPFDQIKDPDLRLKYAADGFRPGGIIPAFMRCRHEGGADTGLKAHAIEETGQFGLEYLTIRHTTAPRYDLPMSLWCKTQKEAFGILEGYGEASDELIIPYACLHRDSLVQRADGEWEKIASLVNRKYSGKVKALKDGKVIDADVTNWHRRDVKQKDWFKLRTDTTPDCRHGMIGPALTPDHKVVTQRGKVRVDELVVDVDKIATDEREFSKQQMSVLLGSLLGDGGYHRKNGKGVGFQFSQRPAVAGYAAWKASAFTSHSIERVKGSGDFHRYKTPFSRYVSHLSKRFVAKELNEHGKRKIWITEDVLDNLGDLGLAIWYQDDGTLVTDKRDGRCTSRIYCHISEDEERLAIDWLRRRFGRDVTYNRHSHFIQIARNAFVNFVSAIAGYVHSDMAYKLPVSFRDRVTTSSLPAIPGPVFYETIREVRRVEPNPAARGNGVRYCLTVPEAGNFLTQVGFVSNCYDADVTMRIDDELNELVDCDGDGNCSWEPFWESMIAAPAVLEIHQTGILLDTERHETLTKIFLTARDATEATIREWSQWPDFNIRSVQQVREFLFSKFLNGKLDENGNAVRLRPTGARSLKLDPVFSTDKPPIPWEVVVEKGLLGQKWPSTNKTALSILFVEATQFNEQVGWIRDHRFLDQVVKSVLKPPKSDDATGIWLTDDDGEFIFDAGLRHCICDDGRIRTHIYQTKETGRWSSARPPLQNISKTRDEDYERLLGEENYQHKLRSIFRASPGCVFIEADFTGAELFIAAVMSGDVTMIEHCRKNNLKESDPDYYDIHSNIAVLAFNLKCAPTKGALKKAGYKRFRTLAKNVIFGVMYGRGAKAIAIQARENREPGDDFVTETDAQRVIDTIFETYPGLPAFFESCKQQIREFGYLKNCFGRLRRFPEAMDEKTMGEFERQGMNFPIQSAIASAMSRAISHLYYYREEVGCPDMYRIVLQIHDAVLLEVPYQYVDRVCKEVLGVCMRDRVPIYPSAVDGTPLNRGPYYLGSSRDVMEHWGEEITKDRCREIGIPDEYGVEDEHAVAA